MFLSVNHLHQQQPQQQQITLTTLQDHYNPVISAPTANTPTNTYYAAGTVAASAAAAALAAAGGPPQTATIASHNNAQQTSIATHRIQQGENPQPKAYTTGRRRNSTLPTSSTGKGS